MSMKSSNLFLVVFLFFLLAGHSQAAGLEKIQFLKISPQEQKAVVKTPEGKLQMVGVGDIIDEAMIVEIVEGRIVLERPGESGPETIIIRLNGKHQRIESILPRGEKPPVMTAPKEIKDSGERGNIGY